MSLKRRSVMLGSLVISTAAGLSACGVSSEGGGSASGGASSSESGGAAASSAPAPTSSGSDPVSGVSLEVVHKEQVLEMVVGPAVRSAEYTVVPVMLTSPSGDTISVQLGFMRAPDQQFSLVGGTLLDLENGQVYGELDTTAGKLISEAGSPLEIFPVYAAIPEDLTNVTFLAPGLGVVAGVPVVSEADSELDVAGVVAEAEIDMSLAGPFPIEHFSAAVDESSDTARGEESVTISVSGDVTFAVDSAELSAEADAVLATVVAELGRYPSGGSLEVVGHTDDVRDEAYNQGLSERRAQAVADRLGQLTDLSAWQMSVSGKGESQPRAEGTSEEARALNRRVEVVAAPSNPAEAEPPQDTGSTELPEATGPVGTGAEGVEVTNGDTTMRLAMPQVLRSGGYLVANLELTPTNQDLNMLGNKFMAHKRIVGERWWPMGTITGVSLLTSRTRYFPADYTRNDFIYPLTTFSGFSYIQGLTAKLAVVWPDTGQDVVTVDMTGNGSDLQVVARLTDIPVVEA